MKSLSSTVSLLGVPIGADDCTTKKSRVNYARILVEIDVSKPLPKVPTVFVPLPVQSDKSTRRATFAGQKETNKGLEEGEWIHVTGRKQNQKAKSVVGC